MHCEYYISEFHTVGLSGTVLSIVLGHIMNVCVHACMCMSVHIYIQVNEIIPI